MRLSRPLKEKRPLYAQKHDKVILLHDNSRPHVAKPVKTYLETFQWEVLPHPPYSPDMAPSDFHLFRLKAHGITDQRFHSYEEVKKWIDSWMVSKDMSFFRRGIRILPERWEKVVSGDGQYFNWNVFVPYLLNNNYFVKKQRELTQGPILSTKIYKGFKTCQRDFQMFPLIFWALRHLHVHLMWVQSNQVNKVNLFTQSRLFNDETSLPFS